MQRSHADSESKMTKSYNRFRAHPWHGLSAGSDAPDAVDAYIEITPFDRVKYEVDKLTGYLRVDRPQASSALPPCLYGFIPRTYCGDQVAKLTPKAEGGDLDPLDICVLSQQTIERAEIVMSVRVIGGLQVVDEGEADDKIIAVLASDDTYAAVHNISELQPGMVDRIIHYFATYKMDPAGVKPNDIEVQHAYGADHAKKVILASMADYLDEYPTQERRQSDAQPVRR